MQLEAELLFSMFDQHGDKKPKKPSQKWNCTDLNDNDYDVRRGCPSGR